LERFPVPGCAPQKPDRAHSEESDHDGCRRASEDAAQETVSRAEPPPLRPPEGPHPRRNRQRERELVGLKTPALSLHAFGDLVLASQIPLPALPISTET